MAKYTMELREIISTFGKDTVKGWFSDYELSDYLTRDEIAVIEDRGVWSKDQLAERIINHFMLREIGQDAIGAFMLMVKDSMAELMETYAPLIYSASLKFDPLANVDVTETYNRETGATSNSVTGSQANGSDLTINSDTPQGMIDKSEILNGKYASSTSASENANNASSNTNTNDTGTEQATRHTVGNSGGLKQEMIRQYRGIIRALNTEIVYNLEPLFMGVY